MGLERAREILERRHDPTLNPNYVAVEAFIEAVDAMIKSYTPCAFDEDYLIPDWWCAKGMFRCPIDHGTDRRFHAKPGTKERTAA